MDSAYLANPCEIVLACLQGCGALVIVVLGTPVGMVHHEFTPIAHPVMPGVLSGTQRDAGVTSCGLDVDVFKSRLLKDFPVCDAVECDTARKAQLFQSCFCVQPTQTLQEHLFQPFLQR